MTQPSPYSGHTFLDTLSMAFNYEERNVDRFEHEDGSVISTVMVTDSRDPYETYIRWKPWGGGGVVVQTYATREQAVAGHQRFVELMLAKALPDALPIDVGTNVWAEMRRVREQE